MIDDFKLPSLCFSRSVPGEFLKMFEVLIDKINSAKKNLQIWNRHCCFIISWSHLAAVCLRHLFVPIDTHRLELCHSLNSNVAERWLNHMMTSLRHASCETFHSGHILLGWHTVLSQAWNTTPGNRNTALINPYLKDGKEAMHYSRYLASILKVEGHTKRGGSKWLGHFFFI